MTIRDNLTKLSKKSTVNLDIYIGFRNKLTSKLKRVRAEYFTNKFNETQDDMMKTWRTIINVIKSVHKSNNNTKIICNDISFFERILIFLHD